MSRDSASSRALAEAPTVLERVRAVVGATDVGARLPSERELAERLGVARMTVRSALQHLAMEGVVHTVHGRGSVRLPPPMTVRVRLGSFAEAVRAQGLAPSTRVLELVRDSDPPPEVRRFLRLPAGRAVTRLRRLRCGDDLPLALERSWLLPSLTRGLTEELAATSLYDFLASRDLRPDSGEERVTAGLPTEEECRLLELSATRPVLRLTRLASRQGRPVEFSEATFPADRHELTFPLDPARVGDA